MGPPLNLSMKGLDEKSTPLFVSGFFEVNASAIACTRLQLVTRETSLGA